LYQLLQLLLVDQLLRYLRMSQADLLAQLLQLLQLLQQGPRVPQNRRHYTV
jgi:hypothetical protein